MGNLTPKMKSRNLFFFGSDKYSQTVLARLSQEPTFQITHLTNLSIIPPITSDTLGLSASFPHLFPLKIIAAFDGRLYNLHPSLLPQYRNVAPAPYAIALGDTVTGITLFRISSGIDNGEIVAQVKEPILQTDTSPILLHRLFAKGSELFVKHLIAPSGPGPAGPGPNEPLIFTHRLTSQDGHVEWPVLQKLLANQPIGPHETVNPLLRLRLKRTLLVGHPTRRVLEGTQILHDLVRGLSGWERVWSIAPTKKGELRITLVIKGSDLKGSAHPADSKTGRSDPQDTQILISGKPHPISLADFTKYYF